MRVPSFIHLELTRACGAGCPQCYAGASSDGAHMEWDVCAEHLVQAARFGVERVLLTGGEPLLYPRLEHAVRMAASLGVSPLLSTSGIGLSAELCRALSRAGLREACVSLNGSSAATHGASRTNFAEAVQAVGLFRASGVGVCVNWVARGDNAADFPGLARLCAELGASSIDVLANKRRGGSLNSLNSPLPPEGLRALARDILSQPDGFVSVELCYEALRRALRKIGGRLWREPAPPFEDLCGGGRVFCDVLTDGAKTPCRHICASGAASTRDMTLAEYWRGEALPPPGPRPCQ
jgi:MoaA/NifB/PqqE/SkfB family radical SAM enzyme